MNNKIIWHNDAGARAARFPAAWLIETNEHPANLTERSALRRRIGRQIVAMQLGLPPDSIEIGHDVVGRPNLARPVGGGLHLSLATRGGIVAVALAHHAVGVDVEQAEPGGHIPLDLLHPAERNALLATPAGEQAFHFARLWALKEAWLKTLGTGLTRELSSFAITIGNDGTVLIDDPAQCVLQPLLASITRKEKGGQLFAAALVVMS